MKKIFFILIMSIGFISCGNDNGGNKNPVRKPDFYLGEILNKPNFNSDNAYAYIEKQISFGPRNPNSEGHKKALDFLASELRKFNDNVELQNFAYPGYNETLSLTNLIARFNPDSPNRIFICAHWDTRPRAEHDEDESKRNLPILGANDGGSGTGMVLELARILKENPVDYGIDLILFDGEDYGHESDLANYALGAKYFAATKQNYNPKFGILLDLVGDKEAVFPKEGYSVLYGREIVETIWGIAQNLNATTFSHFESHPIYDDHVPLNQAGIKTINIVDIDLIGADSFNKRRNYWHTHNDNMENISKETLRQVGEVLLNLIYSLRFEQPNT